MTITRKDTIVLAVLFNIVILAGVLTTAHQLSSRPEAPARQVSALSSEQPADDQEIVERNAVQDEGAQSFDEIDQLLEDYIAEDSTPSPQPTTAQSGGGESKKPVKNETKNSQAKDAGPSDGFYIVKAGDNPWKIAKRFHISFEKLLQLNHLDEAKARNLKVGSRLRIREQKP
jgi:LysM repeat protein